MNPVCATTTTGCRSLSQLTSATNTTSEPSPSRSAPSVASSILAYLTATTARFVASFRLVPSTNFPVCSIASSSPTPFAVSAASAFRSPSASSRAATLASSGSRFRSHSPGTFFGLRGSAISAALLTFTLLSQNPEAAPACAQADMVVAPQWQSLPFDGQVAELTWAARSRHEASTSIIV